MISRRRPHLEEALRIQRARMRAESFGVLDDIPDDVLDELLAGTFATAFVELGLAARDLRFAFVAALRRRLQILRCNNRGNDLT